MRGGEKVLERECEFRELEWNYWSFIICVVVGGVFGWFWDLMSGVIFFLVGRF